MRCFKPSCFSGSCRESNRSAIGGGLRSLFRWGLLLVVLLFTGCSFFQIEEKGEGDGEGEGDPVGETLCENGVDDDGDGFVDCVDPDCAGHQACVCVQDSFCCNVEWDRLCVVRVASLGCGLCE